MALLIWLPLNKEDDFENKGLANITFTNSGATYYPDGKLGGCYSAYLTGGSVQNHIKGVGDNLCTTLTSYRSVCAWVYPMGTHTNSGGTIIATGNYNGRSGWSFGVRPDNDGFGAFRSLGVEPNILTSIPLNSWTHICATQSGNTTKYYKNGLYLGSKNYSDPSITNPDLWTNQVHIGKAAYGNYYNFNGKLNDIRVYDHCLSDWEIKEIARAPIVHLPFNELHALPFKRDWAMEYDLIKTLKSVHSRFPAGLEFYEYLSSDGAAAICTTSRAISGMEVKFKYNVTANGAAIAGLQNAYGGGRMGLTIANGKFSYFASYPGTVTSALNTADTNIHIAKLGTNVNYLILHDDVLQAQCPNPLADTSTTHFGLFSIGISPTTVNSKSNSSIYYAKLYHNEELVAYYVPCKYNGVSGMWDLIGRRFLKNTENTGTLIAYNKISPTTYDDIPDVVLYYDYLEFDGYSRIDSGIKQLDISYDIDVSLLNYETYSVVAGTGHHDGDGVGAISRQLWIPGGAGGGQTTRIHGNTLYKIHNETLLTPEGLRGYCSSYKYSNGEVYTLLRVGSQTSYANDYILIGGTNSASYPYSLEGRVYSALFYIEGEKVRDFVPCKRNSVPGMWDKINNLFYACAGKGTFQVGTCLPELDWVNIYDLKDDTSGFQFMQLEDGSRWIRIYWLNLRTDTTCFKDFIEADYCIDKSNRFSRMDVADKFVDVDGKYEFLLRYPLYSETLYNRWTLTNSPSAATVTDYVPITEGWNYSNSGIRLSPNYSSTTKYQCSSYGWWLPIGLYSTYSNGIPGPGVATKEVELWIRYDLVDAYMGAIWDTLASIVHNITGHFDYYALFALSALPLSTDSPMYNKSYKFAPSMMFVPDALSSSTVEFSISFWIKPSLAVTGCIWAGRSSIGTANAIFLLNTRKIRFDTGTASNLLSSPVISLNEWHHVVCARDSNSSYIYIDGELKATGTAGTPVKSNITASIGLSMEQDNLPLFLPSNTYYGNISDFRIYLTTFTLDDVTDIYNLRKR